MPGIVDMHCDTISALETEIWEEERTEKAQEKSTEKQVRLWEEERERRNPNTLRENNGQLDLLRMKQSGYVLQNFALYVDVGDHPGAWEWAMRLYQRFRAEMEKNKELIRQVTSFDEMMENKRQNRMSALLTIEEGGICEGRIERLHELYRMGARMMTLTWNYPNTLGAPASPAEGVKVEGPAWLTPKGMEFVEEMERLGMILDVSHLSDEGFWNVVQIARKPFVASHSNARSLCGHPRNLTDEMIRKIGELGGVIGLNFYEQFVLGQNAKDQNEFWTALISHAKRIWNLGGGDVLGLGSDFDGIPRNEFLPGAEKMGELWERLHRAGFTAGELDGIFAGNVMRVYREML